MKKNTEQKKYHTSSFFKFAFAMIIFCVTLCGVLLVSFTTRLYKDERFREIEAVSELFIGGIRDEYAISNTIYNNNVMSIHKGFKKHYDISFYVYDADGNCILSADEGDYTPLSGKIKDQIDNDKLLEFNANDFSDQEPYILYGDRFSVRNGGNEPQRMYITGYCTTTGINLFTLKVILFYLCAAVPCVIFAHYFLKRITKKHSDAAHEFLRISEKYSKGDFSEKINITVNNDLQDIAKYVNALAANVEKADETSSTFIANVSHELRTPITTINGFIDGILDGTIPKSNHHEYLVLVSKEIKRLRILISSMLNMTKYESGTLKPNFKETNLTDLVIQIVLMFEKKINDKNLEIEGLDSDRLMAVADADLIQQVIYNLVENAVKFVNDNGTISFRFEKENNMCLVAIRNTGEGLQNTEIQQVFDRFYKTDSSRGKDATGLGLGLSISRKIMHIHNGKIIVKSVYGEYTEFIIQLPDKQ